MSDAGQLFEQARGLAPEARAAFLDDVCRDDPALRAELLSLLERADHAERFFEDLTRNVFASPDTIVEAVLEGAAAHEEGGSAGGSDLPSGHTVGHFRILGRIGAGGMGTVYRAHDIRLDREVALKFLPPHMAGSDEAGERFLVEAKAAAALEHANICTVHEIGETDDGRPFIAMALYEGETLSARLRRGAVPPSEATDIAVQIARGLAVAHQRGIIHRDVKPGNVMITTDGTVKLLDFGLAKMAESTLTQAGVHPGTVAYMSPEQTRGDALDSRTDLWSLGVVLYEMLAGKRPFRGGNDRAVMQAILHAAPEPLRKHQPGTPERLQRIADRLLAKDPGTRFGTARDVLAELDPTRPADAGRPRATAGSERRFRRRAATAVAVVAVLGAGVWLAGRGPTPASTPSATVPASTDAPSIAVLPLANLSADPQDAALVDGMTEELIAALAKVGDLRVIARTSAFAFRDREADIRQIADSLGVSSLVEGGLQKIGSRLRVQIRLVDAADGTTRWSETYEREIEDVFSIQEEIARAVATELNVRLTGGAGARILRHQTTSVAAYESYLRGSDQALLRSDSGVRLGVEHFQRAIAADSTFAAAHAGLARMYLALAGRGDPERSTDELYRLAEAAALTAIALDDSLGEAYAALGLVRLYATYDLAAAEAALTRAIELDPAQAPPREWLSHLYIQTDRPREALAETRRALAIDPLSPTAHAEVAHALLVNGQYDAALAQLENIASIEPPLRRAALYEAQAYALKEMWPQALAALGLGTRDGGPFVDPLAGFVLARAGQAAEARRIRAALIDAWQQGEGDAFGVTVVLVGLGDLDQAFVWLDRAIAERSVLAPNLNIMSPILADLHADPRFSARRARLGI